MGYYRKENRFSDHRPVVAHFLIQVREVDQYKKKEIEQSILFELNGNEHPSLKHQDSVPGDMNDILKVNYLDEKEEQKK